MGDFNVKTGNDNRGYDKIMGQQALSKNNDNGERSTDLSATCDLVIGGRLFQHRSIHKATWVSPIYRQRIRLITCASGRDFEELFNMCVTGMGQMCLQTTISWLHG